MNQPLSQTVVETLSSDQFIYQLVCALRVCHFALYVRTKKVKDT